MRAFARHGLVLVFLACAGCGDNSPPAVAPAAAPTPPRDRDIISSLDYYEPVYKVDENGRVIRLRLTGRHVPLDVLAEVGKLTELGGIDLYGTTVTDEGLAHLKDLQKLRSIGLGGTPITDDGLVHLEPLRSLQWVWVPTQTVSKEAVDKLKKARPDMNIYLQ